MLRSLTLTLLSLSLLAAPAPAAPPAQTRAADSSELVALDLEKLLYEVYGRTDLEPPVVDHGGGLKSISIPLAAGQRERLAAVLKAKQIQILAVGHMISTPSSTRSLISTVLTSPLLDFNYWFVTLNLTDSDQEVKTSRKLKGPGMKFNRSADLTFAANTIQVFWDETSEGLGKAGVYQHQVKGAGAGNAKMRFLAQ